MQVLFLFHARIYDIKLAPNVYLVDIRDVVVSIGDIESRPQGSFF